MQHHADFAINSHLLLRYFIDFPVNVIIIAQAYGECNENEVNVMKKAANVLHGIVGTRFPGNVEKNVGKWNNGYFFQPCIGGCRKISYPCWHNQ